MLLASFKTEVEAVQTPPLLFFRPTLQNYEDIFQRANYLHFLWNSVLISFASTALVLLVAIPAAFAMAFYPTRRTRGTLLWMLSTKMLPAVGVLVPIYLLARDMGLLDSRIRADHHLSAQQPADRGVDAVHVLPRDPEGHHRGEQDRWRQSWGRSIVHVLLPLVVPGIASTALLNIILCWNEAFWSLNLSAHGCRSAAGVHCVVSRRRRACSGRSFRPRPCWPSHRFLCSAGSASASLCAG